MRAAHFFKTTHENPRARRERRAERSRMKQLAAHQAASRARRAAAVRRIVERLRERRP